MLYVKEGVSRYQVQAEIGEEYLFETAKGKILKIRAILVPLVEKITRKFASSALSQK